jgi:hypothetical protein
MAPIPRPLDPPRHGPHADPLPLRGGLSPQVGGAIAGGQILPVGESLAAAHHRQVDALANAEHLGHGAAVLVDCLGAECDHRTDRGQLLQALPRSGAIGALGRLGGVDTGHADR